MVFTSSHRSLTFDPVLQINGSSIHRVNEFKFLRVILDSNLKYTNHVSYIKRKLSYGIRILIKARPCFSLSTLISLYHAFILSHITYCIASWGNTYHTRTTPLQHVQNQAIWIIIYKPYNSNDAQLLKANRLLSTRNLFKYSLSILMHQSVRKLMPPIIFNPEALINNNSTWFASNNNFLLPKVNSNYGKHTASFAAASN